MRTAQFNHAAIEPHQVFLSRLRQSARLELSGPFTDQSGGAYFLRAENIEEAQALALSDPLCTTILLQ
jgi:uncharacterized protein